jgi:ABC-type sugar transport system substrate-binding protein
MKRLLITSLILAVSLGFIGVSDNAAQQSPEVTIGVITYGYEGTAWDMALMAPSLERDMELLPPPETYNQGTAVPQPPRNDAKILLDVKNAATAAEQSAAIDAFIEQGVGGILLTPVADVASLQDALGRATLARIPVVLVGRSVPGFDGNLTTFVGVEPFAAGFAWAKGAVGGEREFMGIASNMNDVRQDGFIRGLEAKAGAFYKGTIMTTMETAYEDTLAAITGTGDAEESPINFLVLADYALVDEVIRAVVDTTANTDRLIKVGTFGGPANFKQLFNDKVLHMVTTQDDYDMFQKALLELKMYIVAQDPLEGYFMPTKIWASASSFNYMSYPYDYDRQYFFTFNRFWR